MIKFGKGNLRVPRLERPVYVVAGGLTDFRKFYPEKQTSELCLEAVRMAVEEGLCMAPQDFRELVNFCIYSQFADHFGDQLLAAAKIHDYLGLDPLGNIEVKTGGATGGSSVLAGIMAIASGYASLVPVIGWERMDEVSTAQGNAYIASAACKDFESELGWLYSTYYALMMQRYLHEYNPERTTLAKIAQKNHGYSRFSPYSQLPGDYSLEEILETKIVSDPLTFLECCVMSVGAACLILADEETAFQLTDRPVLVNGVGAGSHTLRTADRRDMPILLLPHEDPSLYSDRENEWPGFTSFLAARFAAYLAYHMAGIKNPVDDLDLLETHDAFTVSDIQTYEDIGLRPYGQGADFIESGDAYFEGRLPTNLSGGLLGSMHAVGATGIFQLVEIFWQLRNEWKKFHADDNHWQWFGKTKPQDFQNLQVKNAHRGMAVSHAGTGSHVTCTILERGW
ncbi:thiolase domain-containing protein [Patescibacteria group bacterium AH-259-L07]|nr:thiolase domain-containing protein [Patescibacteria group bacterium AH-259-L07]